MDAPGAPDVAGLGFPFVEGAGGFDLDALHGFPLRCRAGTCSVLAVGAICHAGEDSGRPLVAKRPPFFHVSAVFSGVHIHALLVAAARFGLDSPFMTDRGRVNLCIRI